MKIEIESQGTNGEAHDVYGVMLVRRYTLTRTTAQDLLTRILQPLHTCPLEDRLTGHLVSTQMICIQPVFDSYTVQHTH